jgi:hypothetical protein
VSTTVALRGLDRFVGATGVLVADTPQEFRKAMIKVMNSPPLKLNKAEIEARASVYWDRAMAGSGLREAIAALPGAH